jgi:hypothetical protein
MRTARAVSAGGVVLSGPVADARVDLMPTALDRWRADR